MIYQYRISDSSETNFWNTINCIFAPPLFKSVRFPGYAWNAIFSKSTWYGDLKSDVYTIYRKYIGYAGGYMDDI